MSRSVREAESMKLSKNEQKILEVIAKDASLSYRQIAKRCKVSPSTVLKNVERLKEMGIIKRQISIVDFEKLGYDVYVIIQLRVAKGKLFEVEEKIASDSRVFGVYDQTGQFDATVLARFKNRKELDEFLKKIQTYPFIEDTETSLILNVVKENPISIFD
ncbi:MAG: Lrp/AsnC family transcriptional regulator [Candidatus Anstonellales archaeon]